MTDDLIKRLLEGDKKALARMISLVEARSVDVTRVMAEIFPHTGRAQILGFTGPPGAGKSTLVDKVTSHYRSLNKSVGVIAIDPSSPFSGGALLGDRIRMHRHAGDPDVFIRSLGTRGSFGGLSRATRSVIRLMDAAGTDVVIVETVGVGQTELDIMKVARTTMVVLVPESGDVVQTLKAGLTEIADIFIVNKSDRDGADSIALELRQMVELDPASQWSVPVLLTQATKSIGVDELCRNIDEHGRLIESGYKDKRKSTYTADKELIEVISGKIEDGLKNSLCTDSRLARLFQDVLAGERDPYSAVGEIVSDQNMLLELFGQQ